MDAMSIIYLADMQKYWSQDQFFGNFGMPMFWPETGLKSFASVLM